MNVVLLATGITLIIIAIIIIVISVVNLVKISKEEKKEGFFNSAGGALVTPESKAIVGNRILTDQMVYNQDSSELLNDIKKNPYYAINGTLGATKTNTFDKLLQNQLEIQSINNKNDGNVMSEAQMKEINKKITSSADSSNYNVFNRAGAKNVKFNVAPSETRAVIDAKYLGERDRNHQISSVRRVIPVQGFDISVDRIPIMMSEQLRGQLGTNKALNKKYRNGESALKNSNFEIVENVDNPSENTKESFEKYRGSKGLMVNGNYNK